MDKGYIMISRDILDSEIFASEKMLKIYLWCILKASDNSMFVPISNGRGKIIVEIQRGKFVMTKKKAATELNFNEETIYKILQKLEQKNIITLNSNHQFTLVTICNYDSYNDEKKQEYPASIQQVSSKYPASIQQNTKKHDFSIFSEQEQKVVESWVNYRKTIKKPLSQLSIDKLKVEIDKKGLGVVEAEINQSIKNGWQGLFELKNNIKNNSNMIKIEKNNHDNEKDLSWN